MPSKHRPLFITGRFRSGTSFLWQLFNKLDGFCAWYEPLHPQLLQAIEYVEPKADHVGIDDYWGSYRSHPTFKNKYSSEFAAQSLHLEAAGQDYPELADYLDHLLELASPEIPVLQFNRMDLRLSWLRAKYPHALIVHIERNPLQLYASQRKHIDETLKHQPNYWDAYELAQWSFALYQDFPFLLSKAAQQHAFYRFYAIYQLSKLMARTHADVHINLDTDVFQSEVFIEKLVSELDLSVSQQQAMRHCLSIPDLPDFDQEHVSELIEIMTEVDYVLSQSGLLESFGRLPLSEIKANNASFWQPMETSINVHVQMQEVAENMVAELNRLTQENQHLSAEIDSLSTEKIRLTHDKAVKSVPQDSDVFALLNAMNGLNAKMTAVLSEHRELKQKLAQIEAENTVEISPDVDNETDAKEPS